jgi:hypothetical protein
LKFNGAAYSIANVDSGAYSLWRYEHVLYLSTLSGIVLTIAQQLEAYIAINAKVSGVSIDANLKVHRNGDGTPIISGGTPPKVP